MVVRWYVSNLTRASKVVYYVYTKKVEPFGIPMHTLGYSPRFSARKWWVYQKRELVKFLINLLEE